jgi:Zn-finger protein
MCSVKWQNHNHSLNKCIQLQEEQRDHDNTLHQLTLLFSVTKPSRYPCSYCSSLFFNTIFVEHGKLSVNLLWMLQGHSDWSCKKQKWLIQASSHSNRKTWFTIETVNLMSKIDRIVTSPIFFRTATHYIKTIQLCPFYPSKNAKLSDLNLVKSYIGWKIWHAFL